MDLHVNDTPPLDFLLDFSRTYRAAKEAAGINQRFGPIRPSQKRNTIPRSDRWCHTTKSRECLLRRFGFAVRPLLDTETHEESNIFS